MSPTFPFTIALLLLRNVTGPNSTHRGGVSSVSAVCCRGERLGGSSDHGSVSRLCDRPSVACQRTWLFASVTRLLRFNPQGTCKSKKILSSVPLIVPVQIKGVAPDAKLSSYSRLPSLAHAHDLLAISAFPWRSKYSYPVVPAYSGHRVGAAKSESDAHVRTLLIDHHTWTRSLISARFRLHSILFQHMALSTLSLAHATVDPVNGTPV